MKKPLKTKNVRLRFTQRDFNRIKILAKLYAGGCVTNWITYASLNCDRRILKNQKD